MKILKREPSNSIARTELWTVRGDAMDYPFLIYITKPMTPKPDKGWHGIVVTDGSLVPGAMSSIAGNIMMGEVPAAVVVAIGYPLDNAIPAFVARDRDLTPLPWPEWDGPYGQLLGAPAPPSGNADAFAAFVHDELMPFVQTEIGVDPAEWTLAGHSLGGLFATYCLFIRPGRFRRYLAVGSSFWWKKPFMFDRAREFAGVERPLNVSVYLAAGDQETIDAFSTSWHRYMDSDVWKDYLAVMRGIPDIVAETREMAILISRRWGTRVRCDILDDETHGSAVFAAYSRGLRWLHKV
jgi:predicted alpha/beta superfamily hydrolase